MRRGAAPDLQFVLACEEAGRRRGAAVAEKSRKLLRFYRRLAAGKVKRPPPRLSREEKAELYRAAQRRRLATLAARNHQADTPIPVAWRDHTELQEFLDEGYDWAEAKAAREVKHALVRQLVADRYDELATWVEGQGRPDAAARYSSSAAKLRVARLEGHWGYDRLSRRRYMRFRDRSGLVRLDPSESNRDTARLLRRVLPKLLQLKAAGFGFYSVVFSMPNVPLGRLAWGKAELFRMMARALEAVPEVVGRFDAQEDPLAADLQSWNVHVNSLLVVDPRRCTPLPPELIGQAELALPGALGKLPARPARDRAAPGTLSYAKLHYLWGRNQVQLRKIETGDGEGFARALKEHVKYAVKFVSKKQLAAGSNPSPHDGDRPRSPGDAELHRNAPGAACARLSVQPGAGRLRPARAAELFETDSAHRAPHRHALPLTQWPLACLDEWELANRGKRRVRTFGVLFRLERDELPEDPEPDGKLRWCGRVRVSPGGFSVEAARLLHLDLIHGDKSGAIFPGPAGRSVGAQARAGPGTVSRAS